MTGQAMLQAVLAWHVYDISGSALNLAFLGLVRFVPALGVSLIGGAVADTYNRRNIIMIAQSVPLTCGIILATASLGGWVQLELIYALVFLFGLASSFEGPARLALLPAIVRRETFANAVTVATTLQTLGMVTGPVLGAGLIAVAGGGNIGVGTAYSVYASFMVLSILVMGLLRYEHVPGIRRSVSIAAIKEGVKYVTQRQVVLGSMSLDMFAVIFGGAKGLLPIYATDILNAGEWGYGLLYASLEVGAFGMSAVLVMRPPIKDTGRALILTVVAFGLLSMAFALSRNLYLSVAIYMLIGAADQISVVMRNTIIQLATPDELRGRVSSVNQVFIGASNQLNTVQSGMFAAATSATFAVFSGGAAAAGIACFIGWRLRELYHYRTPTHANIVLSKPIAKPAEEPAAGGGGSGG
jgi:MFS family permease